MGSEARAAIGQAALRRDPMAMLPFCGYNMLITSAIGSMWAPLSNPRGFSASTGSARTRTQVHLARLRREYALLKWIVDRVHGRANAVESLSAGCHGAKTSNEWPRFPGGQILQLDDCQPGRGTARRAGTRSSSTSSSIGCRRNSSSSVSFCSHGCGVRPIIGNSHPRTPFGRLREISQLRHQIGSHLGDQSNVMSANPRDESGTRGKPLPAFPLPLTVYEKLASGGHFDAAGCRRSQRQPRTGNIRGNPTKNLGRKLGQKLRR